MAFKSRRHEKKVGCIINVFLALLHSCLWTKSCDGFQMARQSPEKRLTLNLNSITFVADYKICNVPYLLNYSLINNWLKLSASLSSLFSYCSAGKWIFSVTRVLIIDFILVLKHLVDLKDWRFEGKNSKFVLKISFDRYIVVALSRATVKLPCQQACHILTTITDYEAHDGLLLINFVVLIWFRFVDSRVNWFLVKGQPDQHSFLDQRLPYDAHRDDNDVPDEVKFLVDRPPLVEAQMSERYQAVASDEECIQLADDEDRRSNTERWSDFHELWVVFENWLNLLAKKISN